MRQTDDYWVINTDSEEDPGINGRLSKRIPDQIGMTNTITVSSIDEFLKKIIEKNRQIIVTKMVIFKVGWFAQCMDTEMNAFGIIEMDSKAE